MPRYFYSHKKKNDKIVNAINYLYQSSAFNFGQFAKKIFITYNKNHKISSFTFTFKISKIVFSLCSNVKLAFAYALILSE